MDATSLPAAVIVDIDGTVALRVGPDARGPFDYDRVSEDEPNRPVILCVEALGTAGHQILFVSGRESVPGCYEDTLVWIKRHIDVPDFELHMRAHRDYRFDADIKQEMYERHIEGRYTVVVVLDDRDQTVERWRSMGLPCFQVAPGDF